MTLGELLEKLGDFDLNGDASVCITSLTCDSRKVLPGSLFFAQRGMSADGHLFIEKALAAGAAAVVLEDSSYAPKGIPWVKVTDCRSFMSRMAAVYNGDPTASLPLIGITGTNGKTTTTYLIEAIMSAAGLPVAVLGTISYRFGGTTIEASHTTPESTELQTAFRRLKEAGAQAFVMEVSSHALEQKRVDGCHFDIGIFSNLTRDHLDYHGSMESYLEAKLRLFSDLLRPTELKPGRYAVINMDDPYATFISVRCACPVISYGIEGNCDVRPIDVNSSVNGIRGTLVTPGGNVDFASRLLGRFNLSNILAATAAGVALKLPLDAISEGIQNLVTVPGRMERVENRRGVTCLVDYAHTGDALENVLSTLKEIATGRIITVFGCGGDRDKGKRPIMGRIAAGMSDLAIVTSDNPRTEEPFSILEQIRGGIIDIPTFPQEEGHHALSPPPQGEGQDGGEVIPEYLPTELTENFAKKGFTILENRREAIRLAVRLAKTGDIILLAGKGHEDYQIIGTAKHHFDDREVAAAAFAEMTF
ncbi:MAG: UDP-N-acetylmuramoyl-L-alanyl-D-glutamate--2,6-diaminopimelate ligase [Desulfuromonadaceae bacterium]|nr:UDP-N-acetylmuramoyl-L-alanyl-D-glutamate--2,6-diaminopimelate ligase [Desulfuromonadaceae bacterium]